MKIKKTFIETAFDDGEIMLYDSNDGKTYILNYTAKVVYDYLKKDCYDSVDKLFESILEEYDDFPLDYFNETIDKFNEFGLI